ncbi:hypothetical protein CsSME_00007499 [Camellia sinensis var. sinensis]
MLTFMLSDALRTSYILKISIFLEALLAGVQMISRLRMLVVCI